MKTIIIDDDEMARTVLQEFIDEYCPDLLNIVDQCPDLKCAVRSIQKYKPDLIFLDVELQHESGFDLFNYYRNPSFDVIFTTAHDKYAVEAFKFAAIDFLVKPIEPEDFIRSLKRIRDKREMMSYSGKSRTTAKNSGITAFKKLVLPTRKGLEIEAQKNIIYCTGEGNYSRIRLKSEKYILASKTLKIIEELLNPKVFFRIHKSNIVNIDQIKLVNKNTNRVVMSDGMELRISKEKISELLKILGS